MKCVCVAVWLLPAAAAAGEVRPVEFLAAYCTDCHGEFSDEGDRQFHLLTADPATTADLELWQDALGRIELGDMPPSDAEQPSGADRVAAAAAMRQMIEAAAERLAPRAEATVLRRLTRREYDNSVRAILALHGLQADPTADFPPDAADHHFRNIGESLVMSDFLLTRYLEAAEAYLSHADVRGPRPDTKTWTFEAPFRKRRPRPDGYDKPGEYQHVRKTFHDTGGYLWIEKFRDGVPAAGRYRIRVLAAGVNRDHPYPDAVLGTRREDPIRMAVVSGDVRAGKLDTNNPSDRTLAEFELPDIEAAGSPKWFEVTAWLDAGTQPRVAFPNGPLSVKYARSRLVGDFPGHFGEFIAKHVPRFNRMHPDYDPEESKRLVAEFHAEQAALKAAGEKYYTFGVGHQINTDAAWRAFGAGYRGPRVRVYRIEVEGPLTEAWPPESTRRLFGEGAVTDATAGGLIETFAARAFRRPAADADVAPLRRVYDVQRADGLSPRDALLVAYRAALCSPQFLYVRQTPGEADAYDLASKLSYFLWESPPDAELLAAAADRSLLERETLVAQTRRMLADGRSDALLRRAGESWLALDRLGTMLPSPDEHPEYFTQNLEPAMRREVELLLRDAVSGNRQTADLLTTRRAFVNGPLARLYGIEGVAGHDFTEAAHADPGRGGLMTTAAVLTATANGIETSPVVRGVWVLESLLGTPPSPPPPDVEPIEPDTRGATTIREQLAKHRDVQTCAACHARIDPPGFALEAFDEVGRRRSHYRPPHRRARPLPVDASGELPDGRTFEGPAGFRTLMATRAGDFRRNAAEKLLTLATGRRLTVTDRVEMRRLTDAPVGFRDLILGVVTSDAFARRPR